MPNKNYQKFSFKRKLILFTFLSFLLPACLFAQSNSSDKSQTSVNWQLDVTSNGVQFYHAIEICNDKKVVFLKFNNKNNYKVDISWKEEFTTQEGPQIEGYSGQKSITLGLGETSETDCNNPSFKQLVILPGQIKPTYIADISKFDFKTITVTKAK